MWKLLNFGGVCEFLPLPKIRVVVFAHTHSETRGKSTPEGPRVRNYHYFRCAREF